MVSTPPTNYTSAMDSTEAGVTANTTTVLLDEKNQSRKRKQAESLEQETNTKVTKSQEGKTNITVNAQTDKNKAQIKSTVSKLLLSTDESCSVQEGIGTTTTTEAMMESLCEMVASNNVNFDDNRTTAFRLGAPLVIVKVMQRNAENSPKIQKDACSTLAALCFHKLNDMRRHIIEIGGLDCCLEALQRYPDDPDVQLAGCNLIGSLWLRPDVRKSVVDKGGIRAVLLAMGRHKRAELVQSVGCKALFTLLRLEESGTKSCCWDKKAVDEGCIKAVIAAMAHHLTVADLQIAACQFLIILAKRSEKYREEIIQAKGLVATGEARRIHKDNARVVCVARNAIRAINA